MAFEHYIRSGQRLLRCGYTTGTCAALAAAGAAQLLLTGRAPERLSLRTPGGPVVEVTPRFCRPEEGAARCGVVKDPGDDPDVTGGCTVEALVRRIPSGVRIDGGAGVGRVTKPGLEQPVGAAAINRVPRAMIEEAVCSVMRETDYEGGLSVVIEIPGGEELARRTFNPHLGIEGGLSVLGTSGIVEPMSERALVDALGVEIRQAAAESDRIILTPGNYGLEFLASHGLDRAGIPVVRISNFVGDALDMAGAEGLSQVLLAGHLGKLAKLAGGIMNTHSRMADCRGEILCAHTALAGGDASLCRAVLESPTTDGALALLEAAGLRQAVIGGVLCAIERHLGRRAAGAFRVGAVVFSNEYGLLGLTPEAKELLRIWNLDVFTASAWAPETRSL